MANSLKFKHFASATSFIPANVAAGDFCVIASGNFTVGGVSYTAPAIVRVSGKTSTTISGVVIKGTDTWPAVTVTASGTQLAYGETATVATIGGTAVKVIMPAAPSSVAEATHAASADKVNAALTVNGVTYDGSAAKSASTTASDGLVASAENGTVTVKHATAAAAAGTFSAGSGKYVSGVKYDIYGHVTGVASANLPSAPVSSVNGKTGAVSLTYSDVNAASADHVHAASAITTDDITQVDPGDTWSTITMVAGSDVQTMLQDLYERDVEQTNKITTIQNAVSSAMVPRGVTDTLPTNPGVGDVWYASTAMTIPSNKTSLGVTYAAEKGDMLVFGSDNKWGVLNGENQVTASVASTAAGAYAIGTVDGITLYGKDTNTTYSAEKGITLASGKFGHSNSITAETSGVGSKTSDTAFSIVTGLKYDAYGHITSVSSEDIAISAVTSVAAGEGLTLASGTAITSSGTIKHATAYTAGATHDAGTGKYISKITYDKFGHVTKIEDGTLPTFTEAHLGDIKSVTGASSSNVVATNSNNDVTVDLEWIEFA